MTAYVPALLSTLRVWLTPRVRFRATEQTLRAGQLVQVSSLTRNEAEDLLDWLAETGRSEIRLSHVDGDGFRVQYR